MLPIGFTGIGNAAECVDPASLSAAQKSMRKSLGFRAPSADAAKRCSVCAFFTAAQPGCGKCALLSGGIVPAEGLCDSWAKKG
nr:high-potential iron-sulfur protein [Sphingobium sp. BYY-5]